MNLLLLTSTAIYCIGIFFSIALANIGHLGLIGFLLWQFCFDKNFRRKFFDFHRTYKLWIPVVFIVLLAFAGSFRGNITNGFSIFCKYVRILSLLILIPAFIGHHRLQKTFLYSFFVSGACYTIFKYFGYTTSPNIIHTSIYIACIALYFLIRILFTFSQKWCFTYALWATFFTFSLYFVNTEKTGAAAAVAAAIITTATVTVSQKALLRLSVFLFIFLGTLFLSIHQKTTLWERFASFLQISPYSYRILMLKQAAVLIKDSPWLGVGTGNYPKALAEHDFSHLGATGNNINLHAHPHNEWVMFIVLWGVFGLAGLIGLWGYLIRYFIKQIQGNNFVNENDFYTGFALAIIVIYLVSGCCEAVFFMTLPQSAFSFWIALCFSREYEQKIKSLPLTS